MCNGQSTTISKKIFLVILKSKQKGSSPCDDRYFKILSKSCKVNSCEDILVAYNSSIKSFKGNVIGQ